MTWRKTCYTARCNAIKGRHFDKEKISKAYRILVDDKIKKFKFPRGTYKVYPNKNGSGLLVTAYGCMCGNYVGRANTAKWCEHRIAVQMFDCLEKLEQETAPNRYII